MLRNVVQYHDFDGVNKTETVYFNLTKTELMDHLYLQDELETLSVILNPEGSEDPETFTLTTEDVGKVLEMVKKLAKLAYGVRSDDGKRFIKGEQVWTEFTQTALYDAWLFELFTDIEKATDWMVKILPEDLKQIAEQGIADAKKGPVTVHAPALRSVEDAPLPEAPTFEGATSDFLLRPSLWDYTPDYLFNCSDQEFDAIVDKFRQGRNVPVQLLTIGTQRKTRKTD